MAHVQQQILNALQTLLAAGGTAAGTQVYVDQVDPLAKGITAAIVVGENPDGEEIQPGSITDIQQRTLAIDITCVQRGCDATAAAARAFGLAVEKLVSPRGGALAAIAKQWDLTASRPETNGEGEDMVVARVLTYKFMYFVRKASPDAAI